MINNNQAICSEIAQVEKTEPGVQTKIMKTEPQLANRQVNQE
jgi:hypothetical protein